MGSPNTFLSLESPSRITPQVDPKKRSLFKDISEGDPTNSRWVLASRPLAPKSEIPFSYFKKKNLAVVFEQEGKKTY